MYKRLIRPLLFAFDPEGVHHFTFSVLNIALSIPLIPSVLRKMYSKTSPNLERKLWGLTFPNPVGLAAGFDKDARIGTNWKHLGFGFVEIGTITPRPQEGNQKKRLFRLPKDSAIINRMGFNNLGLDIAVERLKKMDKTGIILGGNIGKNKDTPNEKAVEDYLICFEKLFPYVDYFVVNVSSPNTPNLRALQEKEPLTQLLVTLNEKNQTMQNPKPILLKIAPDLTESQLDDIIEVINTSQIQGIIATNTTIDRSNLQTEIAEIEAIGAGGLSGKPLTEKSLNVIRYLHEKSQGKFPIIAVGGIMSAKDAQDKLAAGASLVQIYTGFVYNGPSFVKEILKSL
jgi:dihydroorotate dehydrogenase